MSESFSNICQNCEVENESPFQYCPSCGQKNTDGRITFSELWSEFQDAVFNIESKTWRTLKNLFIPGRLTQEYFSGKHRRYVHPLRLLVVTSVLIIIALSFQNFQSATNHAYNVKEQILKNYERQRLFAVLKNIAINTKAIFPEQQAEIVSDTILIAFRDSVNSLLPKYGEGYSDSIDLNFYVRSSDAKISEKISKYDFLNMDEDELVDIYKKESDFLDRLIFKQKTKFIKDESQLFAAILGHTTWAFLLMMPCLALILYILYFRHGYFYVEHLIFTFHLQSFLFLVLSVVIAGMNVFPLWMFLTFIAIIGVYLFTSMWKVYQQSIGKTLLKFLFFSISYTGIFVLTLFATLVISFLLL